LRGRGAFGQRREPVRCRRLFAAHAGQRHRANDTGLWALWHKTGAWTGLLFELFVQEELLPRLPQGSVLVLDNARIHHRASLQMALEAAGHTLLFLPPYSPDLNPIELLWSWLKHIVRTLAPRDDPQRQKDIRHVLQLLPPQHAPAWFRKCGLTPPLPN